MKQSLKMKSCNIQHIALGTFRSAVTDAISFKGMRKQTTKIQFLSPGFGYILYNQYFVKLFLRHVRQTKSHTSLWKFNFQNINAKPKPYKCFVLFCHTKTFCSKSFQAISNYSFDHSKYKFYKLIS